MPVIKLLYRTPLRSRKARAQDVVTLNQKIEAFLESRQVELAANFPCDWDVVIGRAGFALFEQPEAFLGEGEGRGGLEGSARQWWRLILQRQQGAGGAPEVRRGTVLVGYYGHVRLNSAHRHTKGAFGEGFATHLLGCGQKYREEKDASNTLKCPVGSCHDLRAKVRSWRSEEHTSELQSHSFISY